MVLVLAAAGVFVHARLGADLDESLDASLRARADAVVALAQRDGAAALGSAAGRGPRGGLRPGAGSRRSRPLRVIERTVEGVEGSVRVLARRARSPDGPVVAVVGQSLDDRDETLSALRLPLPAAHDELRRLGETLNDMLQRLRDRFADRAAAPGARLAWRSTAG